MCHTTWYLTAQLLILYNNTVSVKIQQLFLHNFTVNSKNINIF